MALNFFAADLLTLAMLAEILMPRSSPNVLTLTVQATIQQAFSVRAWRERSVVLQA